MGSTQNWVYALLIYFFLLNSIIVVISVTEGWDNSLTFSNLNTPNQLTSSVNKTDIPPVGLTQTFNWGKFFKTAVSFLVVDVGYFDDDTSFVMQYFWLFRIFFIWLPIIFLALAIYYSLPTVSG